MSDRTTDSAPPNDSRDFETPYHYSEDTPEDIEILAILEHPNGPKYAKLNCGNWYFYHDDNSVDYMNWEEYEELLAFIIGDVTSLPLKLQQFAIDAAAKHLNEKKRLAEEAAAKESFVEESIVEEHIAEGSIVEESTVEEEPISEQPIVTVG
jgi:hypothetical protein